MYLQHLLLPSAVIKVCVGPAFVDFPGEVCPTSPRAFRAIRFYHVAIGMPQDSSARAARRAAEREKQ